MDTSTPSPSPLPSSSPSTGAVQAQTDDYHRIAQAIEFLRTHRLTQPDLATVAAHVHLSEYHFQRLFTQWAGISPKRFLQYLTVEYAKANMAQTRNLLDLSYAAGLSSPARLHDLFIAIEAMSPGEFKAGGAGLTIQYGLHPTPFGLALIAITDRGLCNLQFLDPTADADQPAGVSPAPSPAEQGRDQLQMEWPQATLIDDPEVTQLWCDRIFQPSPTSTTQPLTLWVKGTNFQVQVWRALLKLPFGALTSYSTLAQQLGKPQASRAVGSAVGRNPIAYVIPCHRVLRESGELGGYRWGLVRKTAMLGWEASHRVPHPGDIRQ